MSAKIFHLYLLLCSSVFENDVRVVKKQRLLCRLADASGGKRSRFVVSDPLTTRVFKRRRLRQLEPSASAATRQKPRFLKTIGKKLSPIIVFKVIIDKTLADVK